MSFSSDVKNEITKIQVKDRTNAFAVLYASFASIGVMGLSSMGMQLKISYESLFSARYISNLLEKFFDEKCEITCSKENLNSRKSYHLEISGTDRVSRILSELGFPKGNLFMPSRPPEKYWNSNETALCFIRGMFLSCGTITHPKKDYHAEFDFSSEAFAGYAQTILANHNLLSKINFRNSLYVLYLKGGENISNLLGILGAYTALLDFENIRAMRDMRNNINRAANCETANFTKTYSSAQKQLKAIDVIDEEIGLGSISQVLSEAALLRMGNPESSLSELSEISGISKSALNHRYRKLMEIATKLQEGLS